MITLNKIFKRQQYRKEQEIEKRSTEFLVEYKKLVEKFGCDFSAYLLPVNNGEAVEARLRVINVKEKIEKEKEEAQKKEV